MQKETLSFKDFCRTDRELELAFQFAINRSDSDMSLSLCSEFEPMAFTEHDAKNIRIIGRAVYVMKLIK